MLRGYELADGRERQLDVEKVRSYQNVWLFITVYPHLKRNHFALWRSGARKVPTEEGNEGGEEFTLGTSDNEHFARNK